MPLLLEALTQETAESLRRTIDRFESAANDLAARESQLAEEVRQDVVEFAKHATDYAIAELPRAEAIWKWGMDRLVKNPSNAETERLPQGLQAVFTFLARLCVIARNMWKSAETLGVAPERLDELDKAWRRFEQLAHHAKTAHEHRTKGWQPRDPERFAEAMRQLKGGEMKFLTAEEARTWFRSSSSEG